ncbi:TolC family protein [Aquimarina celericrescens]|uniref:TolC family protein n=1 Tax=Aquimarina celericrescens TaxID=1964542 RepID=A0ABW5B0V4_9FLAO|nr:TolC family protein [Aquimarina celericrescens]
MRTTIQLFQKPTKPFWSGNKTDLKSISMKFLNIRFLFLLTSVFISTTIVAQDNVFLSLEDALGLATQNNTDITIANAQVHSTEYALKEAKGNYLPKLFISAGYNRNIKRQVIFLPDGLGLGDTATELGLDNDYQASLNLSFPIFSKFNIANKKFTQTRLNFQKEVSRGVEQSIVNATKKAYFAYLITKEVVKVQQNGLNNAQKIVEDIERRVQQGTLTDFDLTSARVQVANAKNRLLEAQSNIVPVGNSLKLLLGLQPEINLVLTDSLTIIEKELQLVDHIETMLNQNSRLKQMDLDIELSEKQIKMTKTSYYPTVDVIGNYSYQAQENNFRISDYNWIRTSLVGLQLQFPIFNGTVTKNKVNQAKIAREIAIGEKEYATRKYRMYYEELLTELQFYFQKTEIQQENMKLTAEALMLAKKRYQFGIGTFLEVNDAELSYTRARLSWLQAISDYNTTYYDYQLLIGKDLK